MASLRQKTYTLKNGVKVTVKSRPRTSMGNLSGYYVWVNGERRFVFKLEREHAEVVAVCRWIRENCPDLRETN